MSAWNSRKNACCILPQNCNANSLFEKRAASPPVTSRGDKTRCYMFKEVSNSTLRAKCFYSKGYKILISNKRRRGVYTEVCTYNKLYAKITYVSS